MAAEARVRRFLRALSGGRVDGQEFVLCAGGSGLHRIGAVIYDVVRRQRRNENSGC